MVSQRVLKPSASSENVASGTDVSLGAGAPAASARARTELLSHFRPEHSPDRRKRLCARAGSLALLAILS